MLLAIAVVASAPELKSTTDQSAFLPPHYESIQALEMQQEAFPQSSAPAAIIVFARQDGAALTEGDSASVASIGTELLGARIKDVTAIQPVPPSENRLIQIIAVQMTKVICQYRVISSGGREGVAPKSFDPNRPLDRDYAVELCRGRIEEKYVADQRPVQMFDVKVVEAGGRWTVTGTAQGRGNPRGGEMAKMSFQCVSTNDGTLRTELVGFDAVR
ncbi:hypothetical protein AB0M45_18140 [Nocardia sp. NPDC051787]|uniref:hypothetical protein n=1 Tax=Nocardia sp. NPDC051787 TaxID=3155415 RepID=UPI00341F6EE1